MFLDLGLLLSLYAGYRIARPQTQSAGRSVRLRRGDSIFVLFAGEFDRVST